MLDALVGANGVGRRRATASARSFARASSTTRKSRSRSRKPRPSMPMFEMPNMPGSAIGAISLGDIFGKALGNRAKPRRMTVKEAHEPLDRSRKATS